MGFIKCLDWLADFLSWLLCLFRDVLLTAALYISIKERTLPWSVTLAVDCSDTSPRTHLYPMLGQKPNPHSPLVYPTCSGEPLLLVPNEQNQVLCVQCYWSFYSCIPLHGDTWQEKQGVSGCILFLNDGTLCRGRRKNYPKCCKGP